MTQGESAREEVKREILSLAADRQEHRSAHFVEALQGKFAKNTIYKYLWELVDEKYMEIKLGSIRKSIKQVYLITDLGLQEAERVQLKGSFEKSIDKMSPSELSAWTSDLREHGLYVQAVRDAPLLRLKNGKVTGQIGTFTGTVWWKKKERKKG